MSTADPISLTQAKRYAANADTILLRATRPADLETPIGAFLRLGRNLFGRTLRGYPGDVERTGEFGCSTLPGHISHGSGKSISPDKMGPIGRSCKWRRKRKAYKARRLELSLSPVPAKTLR